MMKRTGTMAKFGNPDQLTLAEEVAKGVQEREARQYKWDRRFLEFASVVASWSKDPSTKVGTVIVRADNTVCSTGYNGFPQRLADTAAAYENRELKYSRIIHSEMNAIMFARERVMGYTMYTTHPPCDRCTAHIIQAGISRIVTYMPSEDLLSRWEGSLKAAQAMCAEADVRFLLYPQATA
jgi:dCMP deaminase